MLCILTLRLFGQFERRGASILTRGLQQAPSLWMIEINTSQDVRNCMNAMRLPSWCEFHEVMIARVDQRQREGVARGIGFRRVRGQTARGVCSKQFQLTCWNWNRTRTRPFARPTLGSWMPRRRGRRGHEHSFVHPSRLLIFPRQISPLCYLRPQIGCPAKPKSCDAARVD